MDSNVKYKVIGLMSGTSLDGLDLAYCTFKRTDNKWSYTIEKATTIRYTAFWIKRLSTAHTLSAQQLVALDAEYGSYLGKVCADFIREHGLHVDFIASHGHTVFHQPSSVRRARSIGFTSQIGNGNYLHAASGKPVICDFRSLDVALGGEGAPLVPAGDAGLFYEYDVCLNLGGIANLSTDEKGKRLAWDICFCNMGLNYLAAKAGKKWDAGGKMAASGEVNKALYAQLSKVYRSLAKKRPSLGREIFDERIKPLLDRDTISLPDRLRTFTESIAREVVESVLLHRKKADVLCTGGGAFNSFLISRMLDLAGDRATFILPDDDIIKFKEALVFAFLGVLRVTGEVNCLKSVTGAERDSSGGTMIGFWK